MNARFWVIADFSRIFEHFRTLQKIVIFKSLQTLVDVRVTNPQHYTKKWWVGILI